MTINQKKGEPRPRKHVVPEANHICLIFDDEREQAHAVSEYLGIGIERGELCRFATDVTSPEQVRTWLQEAGVKAPTEGSLAVFEARGFYCPHGHFDADEVIGLMVPRWDAARNAGYKGVRICGEMSWTLKSVPGADRFIEYESRINTVTSSFPHTGMCMYDARLFDGAMLYQVLQVHPFVLTHGQVVINPYYVAPGEFLAGRTRPNG